MRILIAEDDSMSRMLLEQALTQQGHQVVVAVNGREAWDSFQKEYFPVLISDWLMPDLDGLMLCRAVRQTQRDSYTYIVLLTVLHGKANYLEAMEAGADDFVTKPFDAEQLAARVHVAERILGLRRHVHRLEGLLPVCMYCKKIRDDQGQWQEIETYIATHSEARFSHTVCPNCYGMVRET
jgi:phosphoserine phosphatase RsbU/P